MGVRLIPFCCDVIVLLLVTGGGWIGDRHCGGEPEQYFSTNALVYS